MSRLYIFIYIRICNKQFKTNYSFQRRLVMYKHIDYLFEGKYDRLLTVDCIIQYTQEKKIKFYLFKFKKNKKGNNTDN